MKKTVLMITAIVLILGIAVGGTIAWLMDSTGPVTNTFTIGDVSITLQEHTWDATTEDLTTTTTTSGNSNYHFVPGDTLEKDPWTTVKANSEKCYLFISVTVANNTVGTVDPILEWAIADGWTAYGTAPTTENGTYYFYRVVDSKTTDQDFTILKNEQVKVSGDITKEHVTTINANQPTITFKAAAVQFDHIESVDAAYEAVQGKL